MDTLEYWTPADALALRCSVAQVGTLKPAEGSRNSETLPDLRDDVREARLHAPRAFRALVRIMEGDSPRAALEAAREILTRAYGPALLPAPAPATTTQAIPDVPAQVSDEWLTEQRLSYQTLPTQCLPEQ
jgi:hypothetical protein